MSTEVNWLKLSTNKPLHDAVCKLQRTLKKPKDYVGTFYAAGRWCFKCNLYVGAAESCDSCGTVNPEYLTAPYDGDIKPSKGFQHYHASDGIKEICRSFPDVKIVDYQGGLTGNQFLAEIEGCTVVKKTQGFS